MIKRHSNKKKLILFFVVLILTLLALTSIPRISMPLIVAFILSMVIHPIIPALKKLGVRSNFSIILIFLGLALFLVYPVIKFSPLIQEEVEKFKYYAPKIERLVQNQYGFLRLNVKNNLGIDLPQKLIDDFILYINKGLKTFILNIPNVLASFFEWLLLIPLFLFFLLRDGVSLKRNFLKLVPNAIFERTYYLVFQFSKQLGNYILAKFIEAAIIGLIITFGLLFIEVRFAFILGIIASITNIIPYLGPVLGIIPAIIVGFIDYGMSPSLGAITMLYVIANIIDLAFIFPILVSKIVNLHPVVVVISVIIGSQYFGVMGMILSIPMAASIKLVIGEIYREISPSSFS